MNSINLIGNTTADPQVNVISSGDKKVSFTLAVKAYGNDTYFFNVIAWKKTAEIVEKYVSKGDRIGITGHLSSRKYEDKNGERRTVIEVVADDVNLLSERKKEVSKAADEIREQLKHADDEELPF